MRRLLNSRYGRQNKKLKNLTEITEQRVLKKETEY
jgi:hypothetical protein